MLYADFCFDLNSQDAICVAGWTMGAITEPVLHWGDVALPAAARLGHLRDDLPKGATGFLVRFDLNGQEPDRAALRLSLGSPHREVPLTVTGFDSLMTQAPDEVIFCLILGVAEGMFQPDPASFATHAQRRAKAMTEARAFTELPGAALALDQVLCFDAPARLVITGWTGEEPKGAPMRFLAQVFDDSGVTPVPLHREALLRPDLAGARIRGLRVGVTSGFLAAERLDHLPGADAVCVVGLIHDGMTAGTVRRVLHQTPQELGHHHDNLRRALVDPRGPDLLGPLLPALPDHATRPARSGPPPARHGVAMLIEHDLDDRSLRDALRLVRRAEPALTWTGVVAERISEDLFRASLSEREEAGPTAAPVELISTPVALAEWAPSARYLMAATTAALFQLLPFAAFAAAREEGVEAVVHLFSEAVEGTSQAVTAEAGIRALAQGQAFAAQIDQAITDPAALPDSAGLGAMTQMRWLLLSLARAGRVRFTASPLRGFLPGRSPGQSQIRALELQAMRRALEKTAP